MHIKTYPCIPIYKERVETTHGVVKIRSNLRRRRSFRRGSTARRSGLRVARVDRAAMGDKAGTQDGFECAREGRGSDARVGRDRGGLCTAQQGYREENVGYCAVGEGTSIGARCASYSVQGCSSGDLQGGGSSVRCAGVACAGAWHGARLGRWGCGSAQGCAGQQRGGVLGHGLL